MDRGRAATVPDDDREAAVQSYGLLGYWTAPELGLLQSDGLLDYYWSQGRRRSSMVTCVPGRAVRAGARNPSRNS